MQNIETTELRTHTQIMVRQRHELAEWFGFETRNKYEFSTTNGTPIVFAAEQGKGILGFIFRQYLGHWRSYNIVFFDPNRQEVMRAVHPFRWYFREFNVFTQNNRYIGKVVKIFSIFTKKFEVRDELNNLIFEVSSPIWKLWTFPFLSAGRQRAQIQKKWTGLLAEAFTDKDNFLIQFEDSSLTENQRKLILAAALYIDLTYFENKAK